MQNTESEMGLGIALERVKEIGGEFWNVDCALTDNGLFPSVAKWFMSGRSALRFCIDDIKQRHHVESAELPSWCCDSIIVPFKDAGIDVHFYPVTICGGKLVISPSFSCDIVLLMDFFGYECATDFSASCGRIPVIIRDLTHSLFVKEYTDAEYYFGSMRKWVGIWTGGYAWSKYTWMNESNVGPAHSEYVRLRKKAMDEKALYFLDQQTGKDFLSLFACAEEILDSDPVIRAASARDVHSSRTLDWRKIKQKRRENAQYLLSHLDMEFVFPEIKENDCPMFVPVLIDRRQEFRQYMINHGVYLPVHWPLSEHHILDEDSSVLYDRAVSLVCDQRYDIQDMQRMAALIEKWNQ